MRATKTSGGSGRKPKMALTAKVTCLVKEKLIAKMKMSRASMLRSLGKVERFLAKPRN